MVARKARKAVQTLTESGNEPLELPPGVQILTDEEWSEMVDRAARHYLNMSGEEFERKWRAGEFETPDSYPIIRVGMLLGIPFGR